MRTIKDLIDTKKGKRSLIICAGPSIIEFKDKIQALYDNENTFTIGINNMTHLFIPDYHLWTNTQRFRTYGKNIKDSSTVLLGSGINLKTIKSVIGDREYILINYTGMLKKRLPIDYKNGKIFGYYRTAGCLAIMISYLMGASEIDIVGMDGYTKNKYSELEDENKSQHCYGKGFTDTADWETAKIKDEDIYYTLRSLKKYGINFRILTPTVYKEFYYDYFRRDI
jgi:hypothetical protein